MDHTLRHRLADRAFLFDDPDAYLAGVDAALQALARLHSDHDDTPDQHRSAPPATA